MKFKIYLVKMCEFKAEDYKLWATGEFDRCIPQGAYMGGIDEAAIWRDKQGAESFAEEFGGEVVEFNATKEKPCAT